jgi:aminopeptidase N
MWFGDLVTMEWWDDIWLNEGFARCFEYLCLNEIQQKEYKYWDNFIYYIYEKALKFDESKSIHPIVREVNSIFFIDSIFDTISYAKGASVIKMLMHYIGNNNFKKSISLYLKKYKYKNTITSMLWECFDEVSKLKISILMNEWINFSGHPLLNIDIISKNNKYFFKLSQKSMLEDNETIWKIPVFMKSKHFEICRLVETRDYEISF